MQTEKITLLVFATKESDDRPIVLDSNSETVRNMTQVRQLCFFNVPPGDRRFPGRGLYIVWAEALDIYVSLSAPSTRYRPNGNWGFRFATTDDLLKLGFTNTVSFDVNGRRS